MARRHVPLDTRPTRRYGRRLRPRSTTESAQLTRSGPAMKGHAPFRLRRAHAALLAGVALLGAPAAAAAVPSPTVIERGAGGRGGAPALRLERIAGGALLTYANRSGLRADRVRERPLVAARAGGRPPSGSYRLVTADSAGTAAIVIRGSGEPVSVRYREAGGRFVANNPPLLPSGEGAVDPMRSAWAATARCTPWCGFASTVQRESPAPGGRLYRLRVLVRSPGAGWSIVPDVARIFERALARYNAGPPRALSPRVAAGVRGTRRQRRRAPALGAVGAHRPDRPGGRHRRRRRLRRARPADRGRVRPRRRGQRGRWLRRRARDRRTADPDRRTGSSAAAAGALERPARRAPDEAMLPFAAREPPHRRRRLRDRRRRHQYCQERHAQGRCTSARRRLGRANEHRPPARPRPRVVHGSGRAPRYDLRHARRPFGRVLGGDLPGVRLLRRRAADHVRRTEAAGAPRRPRGVPADPRPGLVLRAVRLRPCHLPGADLAPRCRCHGRQHGRGAAGDDGRRPPARRLGGGALDRARPEGRGRRAREPRPRGDGPAGAHQLVPGLGRPPSLPPRQLHACHHRARQRDGPGPGLAGGVPLVGGTAPRFGRSVVVFRFKRVPGTYRIRPVVPGAPPVAARTVRVT